MEHVILVDENDNQIGTEEKVKAHKEGKLHRAFSVFLFNRKGQILLQKRSKKKYHSGGLWTNTCCSHPRPSETVEEAASRRLKEEMGIDCDLKQLFHFIYKTDFDNGLMEHELDYVFVGTYNQDPNLNLEEAEEWKWEDPEALKNDIKNNPSKYTFWFKEVIDRILSETKNFQSRTI